MMTITCAILWIPEGMSDAVPPGPVGGEAGVLEPPLPPKADDGPWVGTVVAGGAKGPAAVGIAVAPGEPAEPVEPIEPVELVGPGPGWAGDPVHPDITTAVTNVVVPMATQVRFRAMVVTLPPPRSAFLEDGDQIPWTSVREPPIIQPGTSTTEDPATHAPAGNHPLSIPAPPQIFQNTADRRTVVLRLASNGGSPSRRFTFQEAMMPGRVVHFEVPFDDAQRATGFYRETFGWNIMPMPEMNYTIVSTGPTGDQGPTEPGYIGGGMTQRGGAVSAPVITVDVDDIDKALAAVEANGGTTVQARMPVGDMGWAAYFTDSEGNVLGMWQTK